MKNTTYFFLLLFALSLLPGCNKDDEDIDGKDTAAFTELLIAHPWKIDRQSVNNVESGIITSNDDPFVIIFREDGIFENAGFTARVTDEEWEIIKGQLYIDEDPVSIEEITPEILTLSFDDEGSVRKMYFTKDEPKDAFPMNAISGNTYRYDGAWINGEELSPEDEPYMFRTKILIEENFLTLTSTKLEHSEWTVISGSFVFVDEIQQGFCLEVDDDGIVTATYYAIQTLKNETFSGTTPDEMIWKFRTCNLWDFLEGPEWVLEEIKKEGVTVSENLPIPLETIWYFNPYTNMVEEWNDRLDTETEYMPWEFKGTPTDDKIEVNITVEDGATQTFTMLKGNIAELELSTIIDSETYLFRFGVASTE